MNEPVRQFPFRLEEYDYDLPSELVAQAPTPERTQSRLLVVDRKAQTFSDRHFCDVLDYLHPEDVLVLNDARVEKVRVQGHKPSGARVDLVLVEALPDQCWRVLSRPTLKPRQQVQFAGFGCAIVGERDSAGFLVLDFKQVKLTELIATHGQMPLPPYIRHLPGAQDVDRYQTVYAKNPGAIAAPTAGLHFSEELLDKIRQKLSVVMLTLCVGYGTFKPIRDLEHHQMHAENFELSSQSVQVIQNAKRRGGRVWAVGTTVVRVLETCVQRKELIAGSGTTNLFLAPGDKFEIVDGLITNFHLPRTTLLLLVMAFMGSDLGRRAYAHAVSERYRFFSYGDAMLIQ